VVAVLTTVVAAAAARVPAQPTLSSAATAVRFPHSVECGAGFRASLTFANDGEVPWRWGEVVLRPLDDSDPFAPARRVPLPAGTEVEPGESHTFELRLTAPEIPLASAVSDWRLAAADGSWFGATASARLAVRCLARIDDSEVVSAVLPMDVACGRTYRGSVTVRNNGTTTWSGKEGYALQEIAEGDAVFAPRRVALPAEETIAPAGEWTFPIAVRAPARAGSFPMEWRLSRRGVGAFGASVKQWVMVRCPTP
jgi:hypothetical protein